MLQLFIFAVSDYMFLMVYLSRLRQSLLPSSFILDCRVTLLTGDGAIVTNLPHKRFALYSNSSLRSKLLVIKFLPKSRVKYVSHYIEWKLNDQTYMQKFPAL